MAFGPLILKVLVFFAMLCAGIVIAFVARKVSLPRRGKWTTAPKRGNRLPALRRERRRRKRRHWERAPQTRPGASPRGSQTAGGRRRIRAVSFGLACISILFLRHIKLCEFRLQLRCLQVKTHLFHIRNAKSAKTPATIRG